MKLKQIFNFIDMMKSHVDISRDFHVDTWADVEFLACHAEKRIPGLGTELIARGVQKLQEMGVKVRKLIFIKTLISFLGGHSSCQQLFFQQDFHKQ